MIELKPNRIGRTVEYKQGHYYLTLTDWQDGHCELEVHRCIPEPLFHSCDVNDLERAKNMFIELIEKEQHPQIILPSENTDVPKGTIEDLITNERSIITRR